MQLSVVQLLVPVCHFKEAARSTLLSFIVNFVTYRIFFVCAYYKRIRLQRWFTHGTVMKFVYSSAVRLKKLKRQIVHKKNLKLHAALVEKYQCCHYTDTWARKNIQYF